MHANKPMMSEPRPALTVSVHKAVQLAGALVTVVLVPRLLGVDDYGRFAFILTLSYLGQIIGDFGTLDIFGCFVPGMKDDARKRLYMHMLSFKLIVGFLCGSLTMAALLFFTDWVRSEWGLLVGIGVALHIISWVPYQFSLGLSRIGIWMTEQAWRQWILLISIVILFPLFNFSGAVIALAFMEMVFCLGGLLSNREYSGIKGFIFSWKYFSPYLRFGKSFFLANLITVTLFRTGPALVYFLTRKTDETGYTNLSIGLFLLVYVTVSQFAQSLIPTLAKLLAKNDRRMVLRKLSRFVLDGLVLTSLCALGIWMLAGHLAPLVFGVDFKDVVPALKFMSLAMPLSVLLWAGNVLATITGRGKAKLLASFSALIVFLLVSIGLVPSFHAVGIVHALTLAVLSNIVVLAINLRSEFSGIRTEPPKFLNNRNTRF